jgi:hypothetical protein
MKEVGGHRSFVQDSGGVWLGLIRSSRFSMALACGLATLAILIVKPLHAVESSHLIEPFAVRNQNPFIQIHGLPAIVSADLLAAGESDLALRLDLTNNSKSSERAQELIILDGETYRASLFYRRGFSNGWQVGFELPLIGHHSGFMDNCIEDWHDFLGFSNSDRDPWLKNRLLFSYSRNGVIEAELRDGTTGVGDLQLQISRHLLTTAKGGKLALNASLELPTGDAERFLGSGSTDLALWLSGTAPTLFETWEIGGYLQAGLLLPGDGDLLSERWHKSSVWFGGVGLHWRAWPWLMLKAQLDAHGAFYDSELAQLGTTSMMLTVGGSVPLEQYGGVIDLAIGENLSTNTVPDFMINLAYRHRFKQ